MERVKKFNFNPQLNKALPASTCMFMHGQLPCLANKQHICGSLVYSSTKTRGQKRKKQKKHVTVYVVNYWDMHMSSFLEGRFIPLYIQTGSLPYLSS